MEDDLADEQADKIGRIVVELNRQSSKKRRRAKTTRPQPPKPLDTLIFPAAVVKNRNVGHAMVLVMCTHPCGDLGNANGKIARVLTLLAIPQIPDKNTTTQTTKNTVASPRFFVSDIETTVRDTLLWSWMPRRMTNVLAVALQKLGVIPKKNPSFPNMTSAQKNKEHASHRGAVKEEEGGDESETITTLRVRQREYQILPKLTNSDGERASSRRTGRRQICK